MRKIVILIIAIFLLTGCSVKYNLVINEDLTIEEEAKLTGTSDFFNVYYKTTKKNVLKSFIDIYKDSLDEKNYQYELKEDNTPYVLVTKKYDNVNDYINNSILFNGYFDEIKYTEDGKKRKIETIGFNANEPDNSDRFDVKELEISIKSPYKVVNHSATSVDTKTNTFYYKLDENNNKILIEYDTGVKFNPYSNIYTIILMCALIIIIIWATVIPLDKKDKKKKK